MGGQGGWARLGGEFDQARVVPSKLDTTVIHHEAE